MFSLFNSVKSQAGVRCTYELFIEIGRSEQVVALNKAIAAETDPNRRGELKKQLPIITWQAYFDGPRKNSLAQPSGLFIFDGDHIANPKEFYREHVALRTGELGILYAGMTPSCHGIRLVARMRPEFATIAEAQQWLGNEIGWECDPACKDLARASYVVPHNYVYLLDRRVFDDDRYCEEPQATKQPTSAPTAVAAEHVDCRVAPLHSAPRNDVPADSRHCEGGTTEAIHMSSDSDCHRTCGLIRSARNDVPDDSLTFKGIPLAAIAYEWLVRNGGEPVEGERNDRLFKLALRLRHITDFNEAALLAVMPNYGLPESEMRTLIHSACTAKRGKRPKDLDAVLAALSSPADTDEPLPLDAPLNVLPPLPPLFKQVAAVAPADFVAASMLCMLPIVGTLGSKLRAEYLDGRMHSPTFLVSLDAPMASGKSFTERLVSQLMGPIRERDAEVYRQEMEYNIKVNELKVTHTKLTAENRDKLLGKRPNGIVRLVPPTISVTKLLMRMANARGLHVFSFSEEIDTVTKSLKNGYSNYSDLMRIAFDNGYYGQDYASADTFSGVVKTYFNALYVGTPKVMRRFFPDVEDGLVSRVCFVMLPDQFGKPMPVWTEMKEKDREEVQRQLQRLDEVSLIGNVVQPDHVMDLTFLNRDLKRWLTEQQEEAVRTNDRTRDVFCRRSAVVGFRAGMLAWFLYGEKNTPMNRKRTMAFARWVANQMLTQHLLRFEIDGTGSNVNHWEEVFAQLPNEFNREDVQKLLKANGVNTPLRMVLYKWRLLGCIVPMEQEGGQKILRFKKAA